MSQWKVSFFLTFSLILRKKQVMKIIKPREVFLFPGFSSFLPSIFVLGKKRKKKERGRGKITGCCWFLLGSFACLIQNAQFQLKPFSTAHLYGTTLLLRKIDADDHCTTLIIIQPNTVNWETVDECVIGIGSCEGLIPIFQFFLIIIRKGHTSDNL